MKKERIGLIMVYIMAGSAILGGLLTPFAHTLGSIAYLIFILSGLVLMGMIGAHS